MVAGSNPGGPASHPAPCLWPGKAVEDGPDLGPSTCMRDPEEAPGSWFRIGSALAIAATWGVNPWIEDLPLCLSSSSLYI